MMTYSNNKKQFETAGGTTIGSTISSRPPSKEECPPHQGNSQLVHHLDGGENHAIVTVNVFVHGFVFVSYLHCICIFWYFSLLPFVSSTLFNRNFFPKQGNSRLVHHPLLWPTLFLEFCSTEQSPLEGEMYVS